ncbi:MAG TPA: hypothetical protein VIX63_16485, partial [Vicinamibacterales bacterium]
MTARRTNFLRSLRRPRVLIVAAVVVAGVVLAAARGAASAQRQEIDELARLLDLRDRMAVAEIGAGSGWLTVEVARRIPA